MPQFENREAYEQWKAQQAVAPKTEPISIVAAPAVELVPVAPKPVKAVGQDMSRLMPCPACGHSVSKKKAPTCPQCGHQIRAVAVQEQRKWTPGVAAVLSLFIPGLVQAYKGQIFNGLLWFVLVLIGYVVFIVPGLVLHVCCIVGASRGDPTR